MKRFLITSPKFSGIAELTYKDDGLLCMINLSGCEMTAETIMHFKRSAPSNVNALQSCFSAETIIVETTFEVSFEMFWNKYNKKINKARCIPLWNKLNKADQVKAYYGIDQYIKYLKKESWRNMADPEAYLRNRYFENEY